MNLHSINDALSIVSTTGHVIIATADRNGLPHVAVGYDFIAGDEPNSVNVSCRFCPGTLANIHKNDRLALVAWDAQEDVGLQLVGRVRQFDQLSDQEQRMNVLIEQVADFTKASHTDASIPLGAG